MRRYVLTFLYIGGGVSALVLVLFFVGVFEPMTEWLRSKWVSQGLLVEDEMVRMKWIEGLVIISLAAGVSWCVIDVTNPSQKVLVIFCSVLLVLGFSPTLALHGVLFDPFSSLAAVALSAAASFVFAGTEKGMRKRVLETLIGRRVSHRTFNELLEADEPPDFGGVSREVTVVTCRLFNHEELQAKLKPSDLVKMSNLFLRSVSTFLTGRGAYLDESGPELVRGYFGMLKPSESHAFHACRAALELRSRLKNLSKECETRWFQGLTYGVGISSGPMTIGVYGADEHFFFSGIGAETDYSRRLSHANDRYGSDLLIGPHTYHLVKSEFEVRPMEMFFDPAANLMTEIYQLLATKEAFGEVERERRDLFWQGVIFLREERFEEALDHLSRARNPAGEDAPLDFFIERAQSGVADKGVEGEAEAPGKHARLINLM
ncbi:MAG: adenylate/guanylate cyclase domain-containing protein [Verrucomicrobiales bacterium]|nr:adenylate/guanylate cyclase domain-containing protein [Verrucomicrobiales bacterium]